MCRANPAGRRVWLWCPGDNSLYHLVARHLGIAGRGNKRCQRGILMRHGGQQCVRHCRVKFRQITLQIQNGIMAVIRINGLCRLEHTVRSGRVIGAGHHRMTTGITNHGGYVFMVGGHPYRCQIGRDGAFPDMLNHRLASKIGKRFAGQARSRHTGRNDDYR